MLADTPPPPYTAVIFTSVRAPGDDDGYARMAEAMERLARAQPGFLGIESARGPEPGEGITVSYWAGEDEARAWKEVAQHQRAQALGRQRWYQAYRVRVAQVSREYGPGPAAP